MTWKKALFFGGAILILTACSDATAPTEPATRSQFNVTNGSASLTDTTGTLSGYYVRAGTTGLPGTIFRAP